MNKDQASLAARESGSRRQHHLHRKAQVLSHSKKSSALYIKTRRWYDSKLDARGNAALNKRRVTVQTDGHELRFRSKAFVFVRKGL